MKSIKELEEENQGLRNTIKQLEKKLKESVIASCRFKRLNKVKRKIEDILSRNS